MIRPIDPLSSSEIEWVATHMWLTLMEVLGDQQGGSMYTMDWLRERVPEKSMVVLAKSLLPT